MLIILCRNVGISTLPTSLDVNCLECLMYYDCSKFCGVIFNDVCADVNECREIMIPCGENAQCVNLEGSHSCFCLEGYEGNATNQCESKTSSDNIDLCTDS